METTERDPHLWRMAKARARFKSHLLTYVLVNALLWAIWAFTSQYAGNQRYDHFPWPIFPTVFWGFGVAMQWLRTYGPMSKVDWSEREYEKLKRRKETGQL